MTRVTSVWLAVAAIIAALVATTGTSSASTASAASNGGFEQGLAGWVVVKARAASVTDAAHSGARSVALTSGAAKRVVLRDRPNIVLDTDAHKTYEASVWVHSAVGSRVIFRLREKVRTSSAARTIATSRARIAVTSPGWKRLTLSATPGNGHELAIAVVGRTPRAGQTVRIDDLRVAVTPRRPTASGAADEGASSTPSTGTGATRSGSGKTLFGLSLNAQASESTSAALSRHAKQTGTPAVYRVFYPGAPVSWPGPAGQVGGPVVVSFKLAPQQVITGKYDSTLKSWFAKAPTDRTIYWAYYHEPENDIARKAFTPAQYRQAWTRIAGIAHATGKSNLKATLVLMSWSVNPGSHRNWKDYYAGSSAIDVLAWDAYNDAAKPSMKHHEYSSPAKVFGGAIAASRAAGKPFGFAEWATLLLKGDNGSGRAAWIRQSGAYLRSSGALFATYFDTNNKADFRLTDRASQQALASLFNR